MLLHENKGPLTDINMSPQQVNILMQQHVGAPAQPVVSVGDRVKQGDLIGAVDNDQLGTPIHASIDGIVKLAQDTNIIIEQG